MKDAEKELARQIQCLAGRVKDLEDAHAAFFLSLCRSCSGTGYRVAFRGGRYVHAGPCPECKGDPHVR